MIATGLAAPEGPVVGPGGWILTVCSRTPETGPLPTAGGDIVATHPDRPNRTRFVCSTSTADVVGVPAGLAFGPDAALYVCDSGRRAVLRMATTGAAEDFLTTHEGERFNGPNDLAFDADGNMYFTDPYGSSVDHPVARVYGWNWKSGQLHLIDHRMAFSNGIALRGDGLYVAETLHRRVWRYRLRGDGSASGRELFCTIGASGALGPDGLCFDADGHLYVASFGGRCIEVFDVDGRPVDRLLVPGVRPTNVCFGGPGHDALFVTMDDTLELVQLQVGQRGGVLPHCPSQVVDHPFGAALSHLD